MINITRFFPITLSLVVLTQQSCYARKNSLTTGAASAIFKTPLHNRAKKRHASFDDDTRHLSERKIQNEVAFETIFQDKINLIERGGSQSSLITDSEFKGAFTFLIFDILLRKLFEVKEIKFPSMMAASVLYFIVMVFSGSLGESMFQFLSPGAGFLAKWLPAFFVPGLAMLPLAPKIGPTAEVSKVLATIIIGILFTLTTTAFSTLALRTAQGQVMVEAPAPVTPVKKSKKEVVAPPPPSPTKAYPDDLQKNLCIGSIVLGLTSVILSKTSVSSDIKTPIQTIFMIYTTFYSFVFGANLPKGFTKIFHPTLFSTFMVWITTAVYAKLTGSTFLDTLKSYKVNSFAFTKVGAGDIILYMLGPAVGSLSIAMYSRKKLLVENLLVVLTGMIVSAAGGLFGTAFFVRLIQMQSSVVKLSLISRNVTTALSMAIAQLLGGNISIAASVVVLTGIIGGTFGTRILDAMNVKDPLCRGLSIGAAAQGLGVASIVHEKDAFPFAAINMILTALMATVLASIPSVGELLKTIAIGGAEVVTEAAV